MTSKSLMKAGLIAGLTLSFQIASTQIQLARQSQQPGPTAAAGQQSPGGETRVPDPRVQQRTYRLTDTNEQLPYALFVSSKVSKDKKNPLIVALHGLGGNQNTMMSQSFRTVELAEQSGYILVAPMGYNSGGWYGIPYRAPANGSAATPERGVNAGDIGTAVSDPAKRREMSEKDVLNVLAMIRKEFNVDERRTYLMGHSMGGAGSIYLGVKHASNWAAIAAIAPASGGLTPDNFSLAPAKDMPMIIVQGDADTAVPVARTRQWVEKIKALNMTHQYVEIPGGTHGDVIATGMPDIFAFFAKHTKGR